MFLPDWCYRRPSTTIVSSFRPDVVAAPGYRRAGDPPRQNTPDSVEVSIDQAAVLQGFPVGYPWQGSESKKRQQIGNAVPPTLAEAILRTITKET